jgi:hypothetical protein
MGYGYNERPGFPSQFTHRPKHGADVEITTQVLNYDGLSTTIKHIDKRGVGSLPLVRSYKDGLRVGFTFISNEALKKIHGLHAKFLQGQDEVTHQEGQ